MNQLKIHYGTSAVVIPGKITEVMDRASATDIKVLLCLCASPELCRRYGDEDWAEQVAEAADCYTDAVQAALGFWRGVGLLQIGGRAGSAGKKQSKEKVSEKSGIEMSDEATAEQVASVVPEVQTPAKPAPKLRPKDELPHYTTEQLAALLEAHEETAAWLGECQRVFGKMFNTLEVNTILGFVDYLGLDWEYVLLVLSHYVSSREQRGLPKSIKGVSDMVYDLNKREINTVAALQEEIKRLKLFSETEGKLRTLFGMGERGLTPTEKKYFSTWLYEYAYDMEIIRMAYDVTVDTTGKANIKYMNSVLANWNRDGLRTTEAIKAADEAHKASNAARAEGKKKNAAQPAGSFDTDDFFAAAVRRSFGDDTPKN